MLGLESPTDFLAGVVLIPFGETFRVTDTPLVSRRPVVSLPHPRIGGIHVQHRQKALEQMNVKLAEVVSDITGMTGLSIIDAILGGERDPMELAKRRDQRCHHSEALIALALEGKGT